MVVKTDWESLHVVDLWMWSDILVLSETCLVGVERLVTRGRMMSARARLDMNNNESLLLEFWKKSQIFNWSFDCFTYSDIQCDWEDEDNKVEDSNDESRIVGERKQFVFIILQSSEVFNICFNKFIQWHIHNWDSNSTVHQADSSLYIASLPSLCLSSLNWHQSQNIIKPAHFELKEFQKCHYWCLI